MVGVAESTKSDSLDKGKLQEELSTDEKFKIVAAIKHVGQDLPDLSADDWIALRDDPDLDGAKEDLWMYGNEVRALMDFIFDLKDPNDIIHERGGSIGVTANRVLKDLAKKDMEEQEKAYKELDDRLKKALPSFDDLDEGFNGDEVRLIARLNSLKDGEVLKLRNRSANADMCIKKNSKFPGRFILWNETKDGEVTDKVNFSSLDNAIEWAKRTDDFLLESADDSIFKHFGWSKWDKWERPILAIYERAYEDQKPSYIAIVKCLGRKADSDEYAILTPNVGYDPKNGFFFSMEGETILKNSLEDAKEVVAARWPEWIEVN